MNDNFDLTPATSATEQTPTADTTTVDTTTDTPAPATLPKNYLVGGYYATTDKGAKYLRQSKRDEALGFCRHAARHETRQKNYAPI